MIGKNRSAVVIPLYKSFCDLTAEEVLSLKSTCRYLHEYPHVLVGPENLQWNEYLSFFHLYKVDVIITEFASSFFYNIEGYNRLLMSCIFYKKFKSYKYILVFQMDAFVFKDELKLWCDKGYDYIGAPWNGIHYYFNTPIDGVGNGGFSLRKIKSSIKLLEKIRMNEVLQQYHGYNWKGLIPKLPSIIKKLEQAKKIPSKCEESYHFQEDYFWCNVGPAALSSLSCRSWLLKLLQWLYTRNHYKIAPKNIAVSFSLETNARELFEKNNNTLPFGCHAWEKYEPDFWKEFIPMNELVK